MRNANPAFLTCSYSSVGYISNIAGASAGLANRWQKPGDEAYTNVPKAVFAESGLSASSLYSTYFYSDINILDASYIRLNNNFSGLSFAKVAVPFALYAECPCSG